MFTRIHESPQDASGRPTPRRGPGRPRGATSQGTETRQTLYRVATELFATQGYEATTLRAIADRAGVSPGLLYRYFPSKRAVVLALYDELSLAFERRTLELPAGRYCDRFGFVLAASLDVLRPHRETLVALVPILVSGRDEGLFAPASTFSRERVRRAFVDAVVGSRDAPRRDHAERLGRALDLVHLCVLLFWLLDRSQGQGATSGMVALIRRVLPPFALAFRLPLVRDLVGELDRLARQALYGEHPASPLPAARRGASW